MTRSSRGEQREQPFDAETPAAGPAEPLDVRVTAAGALVGGARVTAPSGEELQRAVLKHLHTLARAAGRPVLARIHDERIGYVVPLQVAPDGASTFTGEPVRMRPEPRWASPEGGAPSSSASAEPSPSSQPSSSSPSPSRSADASPFPSPASPASSVGGFGPPPVMGAPSRAAEPYGRQAAARPAGSPYVAPPQSARPGEPNPYLRPTEGLCPESGTGRAPAPEPRMTREAPVAPPVAPREAPVAPTAPLPPIAPTAPLPPIASAAFREPASPTSATPTPPRGFDAIAEAVLDEGQGVAGPLAEPMAGINEAVRSGQVDRAAELAGRVLAEASGALGAEHPEVLRLRELAAYIAYLAGDGERALTLSLELARVHRARRDAEAAYGNVQSAATAWRAVRDPRLGLHLGRELIGLWTELVAEGGPAADDLEELESAHARMGRLKGRAERAETA
ncbi:tetratricopeptide repeat protein [Streptomyces sp. NPDC053367]|uniref:tetratricopeptide repeat protein n=1 Tax=Streptomyces sp. NPDC053367 TaxID=3365700 RepID=UPI0037D408FD